MLSPVYSNLVDTSRYLWIHTFSRIAGKDCYKKEKKKKRKQRHDNTRTLELGARRTKNSFSFLFSGRRTFIPGELIESYQNAKPLCKKCTLYDIFTRYIRINVSLSTNSETKLIKQAMKKLSFFDLSVEKLSLDSDIA